MINVDTIGVYGSLSGICDYWELDPRRFVEHTTTRKEKRLETPIISTSYELKCDDIVGISSMWINEKEDLFKLEASSKVLQEDYFKHLNINTVDEFIAKINKTLPGVVELNPYAFMEIGYLRRLDVLADIDHTEAERQMLLRILHRSHEDGYNVKKWRTSRVFEKENASDNGDNSRLTTYGKFEELKAKNSALNFQLFDPYTHFLNTTRTELNIKNKRNIRKYFKLDKKVKHIPVKVALLSDEKPLSRYMKGLIKPNIPPSLYETHNEKIANCKTYAQRQNLIAAYTTLEEHNWSFKAVKEDAKKYWNPKHLNRELERLGYKKLIAEEKKLDVTESTLLEKYLVTLGVI